MNLATKNTITSSKKKLFSGDIRGLRDPNRPPWAVDESLFDETCTNCGDCIEACPQNILIFARGKLPVVDFTLGECTFCEKCEISCEANALDKFSQSEPWLLKAEITESCLATKKITCRSCEDPCPEDAIQFKLAIGGMATPKIVNEQCTGCGACLASCPSNAISIN